MYIGHVSQHFSDACKRINSDTANATVKQDEGNWLFRLVCKLLGI